MIALDPPNTITYRKVFFFNTVDLPKLEHESKVKQVKKFHENNKIEILFCWRKAQKHLFNFLGS